jgi:hypothetical protein
LSRTGAREARLVDVRSDRSGEFGERGSDAPVPAGVDPEFVVASPQVLRERVTSHDHPSAAVAFEAPHRAEPGLELPVVGFDALVRVLLGVVKRRRMSSWITARSVQARSVTTSAGSPCARSVVVKNRRAAWVSWAFASSS